MELLLLSSSRTLAGYLTDYLPEIEDFSAGTRRAVFVPFAAVAVPWAEYAAKVSEATGLELHPLEELGRADLIIVGGGNTFQLLRECRVRGLLEPMRSHADRRPGRPGRARPAAFPDQTHYVSVALPGHHGETRDERLAEYARANPQVPVIGLPEGDWLRVSGSSIELRGAHAAVWFHGEKAPARIQPGTPTPSGDSL